jgi:hypothetical protein
MRNELRWTRYTAFRSPVPATLCFKVVRMDNLESLDQIFKSLREGNIPETQILQLYRRLNPSDAKWLMEYVVKLKGPEEYLGDMDEYDDGDNAKSEVIVEGFFKFIDLISGLIIKLGGEAIREAENFENSISPYVPWVLKYCTDQRFAKQISVSFPFLDI